MSHLTLWGYLGWLLSLQRWSHSLCTQFQTATLQTGTAGSKTQSTIQTLSCLHQTAFVLCDQYSDSGRQTDVRISPGTPFWLVRARWDAAERERSGCLKSPSHRSVLGHPKNVRKDQDTTCQLTLTIQECQRVCYVMTCARPCLCCNRRTADAPRGIDSMKDWPHWDGEHDWPGCKHIHMILKILHYCSTVYFSVSPSVVTTIH